MIIIWRKKRTHFRLCAEIQEDKPLEKVSSTKQDWRQKKEEQARIRKRENDLKKTEKAIEDLESRDKEIDEELAKPEIATDPSSVSPFPHRESRDRRGNWKNFMKNGRNLPIGRSSHFLLQRKAGAFLNLSFQFFAISWINSWLFIPQDSPDLC